MHLYAEMTAQLMAIHHPDRLLSLGAIMSTTSEQYLPRGKLSLLWELFKPRPKKQPLDQAVNHLVQLCSKAGVAQYQEDAQKMEQRFRTYLQRSLYPEGAARQAAAVATATSRKQSLGKMICLRWLFMAQKTHFYLTLMESHWLKLFLKHVLNQ